MADVVFLDDMRHKTGPAKVMCEITCYDDGSVTVWLSDGIEDVDQFNWLFAKVAGATGSLFGMKLERTGSE